MSDEAKISLNIPLPKTDQYERASQLTIRGDSKAEVLVNLAEVIEDEQLASAFFSACKLAVENAVGVAAQGLLGAQPPQQQATVQPVGPAPAPPPPAPNGGAIPQGSAPTVKAMGEVPPGATLGTSCSRVAQHANGQGLCGAQTYWQPPGVNFQTKEPYEGYWRCPNARNHVRS